MRRYTLPGSTLAIAALALAAIGCSSDDTGDTSTSDDTPAVTTPEDAQRAQYRAAAPDATDAQIDQWITNVETLDDQVEAWNDCLEQSPTGEGCTEPDYDLTEGDPIYGD